MGNKAGLLLCISLWDWTRGHPRKAGIHYRVNIYYSIMKKKYVVWSDIYVCQEISRHTAPTKEYSYIFTKTNPYLSTCLLFTYIYIQIRLFLWMWMSIRMDIHSLCLPAASSQADSHTHPVKLTSLGFWGRSKVNCPPPTHTSIDVSTLHYWPRLRTGITPATYVQTCIDTWMYTPIHT